MRAGTEGQTRIEHHVDGIFIRNVAPARADPQPLTEAHRMEVIHPFPLPVFIFQLLDLMRESGAQQRVLLQLGNDRFHIGFGIEQADHVGVAPQPGFPG